MVKSQVTLKLGTWRSFWLRGKQGRSSTMHPRLVWRYRDIGCLNIMAELYQVGRRLAYRLYLDGDLIEEYILTPEEAGETWVTMVKDGWHLL